MGHRSGLPDLVAVHHDGRTARTTIERLSRAGIDGGAITLLGRSEVVTAGRYGDRQTDRGSSLALGGRVVRGMAWGVLPGAAFGALLLGIVASWSSTAILAGAGGGAFFGASVGALTGLLAAPTMVSSWERTFSPLVPGGVLVGVRVDDDRAARRVRRVLRVCAAHTVYEVPDVEALPDDPPGGPFGPAAP